MFKSSELMTHSRHEKIQNVIVERLQYMHEPSKITFARNAEHQMQRCLAHEVTVLNSRVLLVMEMG